VGLNGNNAGENVGLKGTKKGYDCEIHARKSGEVRSIVREVRLACEIESHLRHLRVVSGLFPIFIAGTQKRNCYYDGANQFTEEIWSPAVSMQI